MLWLLLAFDMRGRLQRLKSRMSNMNKVKAQNWELEAVNFFTAILLCDYLIFISPFT